MEGDEGKMKRNGEEDVGGDGGERVKRGEACVW